MAFVWLMGQVRAFEDQEAYRARGGFQALQYALSVSPETVVKLVQASGLRGRGGAGFPTGRKWQGVRANPGPRTVIVNGEEGEPGSQKDTWLMRNRPHLVLEGALIAAWAMEADNLYFYLSVEDWVARQRLEAAVRAWQGSPEFWPLAVELVAVPHTYVAGEETAAVAAVEGELARPRFKPPRPFEAGVRGQPTLVQNVETLAHLPYILREGPEAFRQVGTASSPGTLLVTLRGAVQRPGVYEVAMGTPLGVVIEKAGGGIYPGRQWRGVLTGGYFGGFVGPDPDIRLDFEGMQAAGGSLGNGELTVLDDRTCPLELAGAVTRFFAVESCGQCGVCQRLTKTLAELVADLAVGRGGEEVVQRLARYGEGMRQRGACALPDGAVAAVRTLLKVFPDAVASHLVQGRCEACVES